MYNNLPAGSFIFSSVKKVRLSSTVQCSAFLTVLCFQTTTKFQSLQIDDSVSENKQRLFNDKQLFLAKTIDQPHAEMDSADEMEPLVATEDEDAPEEEGEFFDTI